MAWLKIDFKYLGKRGNGAAPWEWVAYSFMSNSKMDYDFRDFNNPA